MTGTTMVDVKSDANDKETSKEKKEEVVDNEEEDDDDEDDEDDEDYKPEEAVDDDGGDEDLEMETDALVCNPGLSYGKRKAVDESFERLFGYKWGTEFDLDNNNVNYNSSAVHLLLTTFGPTKTAKLLGSQATGGKRRKITTSSSSFIPPSKSSTESIDMKELLLVAQAEQPKEVTTETKVFAGQAIQVQRQQQDSNNKQKGKVIGAPSKLDNVLAQLAGPTKLSTVQKTSDDWEQFKHSDKQLQEELEKKAQGKDAFLVKQDFLNRVDHRRFELEKDERDRERAKRGK